MELGRSLCAFVFGSVVLCIYVSCRPIAKEEQEVPETQNSSISVQNVAIEFMKRYGYIEPDTDASAALYSEEGLSQVIKNIQKFGAIPQTGALDNATLKLMNSPRCGVPDVIRGKRQKRYVLGSKGWSKRKISYFIANWPHNFGEKEIDKNIKLGLDAWGRYARLEFQKANDPNADIVVAFASGYHGDNYPFDGRGSILAHAYFPYESSHLGGDVHFDADENWTDKPSEDGIHFFSVAVHELGHSLGLAHSFVESSVMFPYYKDYGENFALDYDDVLGMYELYIRRNTVEDVDDDEDDDNDVPSATETTYDTDDYYETFDFETSSEMTVTSTTENSFNWTVNYNGDTETVDEHKNHDTTHNIPTTNSPSLPDICQGHFDAVATLRDELFIFKEQYVWRLKQMHKIEDGYPVQIQQMFPKFPESIKRIDAAYQRPDGMIIIFTGKVFWVYDGDDFIEGSPKPLSYYGLPSNLESVDAAQVWAKNGKTYIYKDEYFWRYNETSKTMDLGYPRHMEKWRGVPSYLDSATTWKDGITYFFKGKMYWKFDNNWVVTTDTSPLPTPQVWLGCPKEEDET